MPYFNSSAEENKRIYYETTEPADAPPKAVIQVIHGMCEYFGRYAEFAEFMNRNGFAVAGSDQLGHGRTARDESERGFFAENNGWRFLVRDQKRMTDILREKYPDLPIIIFGHSMGSFIARLYMSWYPEGVFAAIFMGTSGGVPSGAAKTAVKLLESAKGTQTKLDKEQWAFYRFLTRRVENSGDILDWITRDKEKISFYKTDELGNFAFTAGAYRDLVRLLNEVSARDWAYSLPKKLPVLLMSGDEDPIGDYGKGVKSVYRRLKKAGMEKLYIKLYAEARHELISEINRGEVYEDILNWLNKRLEESKNEKTLS